MLRGYSVLSGSLILVLWLGACAEVKVDPTEDPLAAPTGVVATEGEGDGTVTVQWQPVTGAESYTLYWATAADHDAGKRSLVSGAASPFVHGDLDEDVTYYYEVAGVNGDREGDRSEAVSATTRRPRISGKTAMADLQVSYQNGLPAGGVYAVCLFDLAWKDPHGCDPTTEHWCNCSVERDAGTNEIVYTDDRVFSLEVSRGQAYVVLAYYGGQQVFAALTPNVARDIEQDINLDTETAMNLIALVERELNGLDPLDLSSLAGRTDDLLSKANEAVDRLNEFLGDRNAHRDADRLVDAVRNFTIDRANQGSAVLTTELDGPMIRAYGGGTGKVRALDALLESPLPPFNPHFTFTREYGEGYNNVAISDLEAVRWDYLAHNATAPHIPTGGTKVVYTAADEGDVNAGGHLIQGVHIKDLGANNARRLTPDNLICLTPSLSPDQSKIVFGGAYVDLASTQHPRLEYPNNLFVMNADGTGLSQLTFETKFPADPAADPLGIFGNRDTDWSPDGSWVTFYNYNLDGNNNDATSVSIQSLRIVPKASGAGYEAVDHGIVFAPALYSSPNFIFVTDPSFSTDGSEIWFSAAVLDDAIDFDIYFINANADPSSLLHYARPGTDEIAPSLSHDGRFVVYEELGPGGPSLKVMNRYTGENISDLGNFANATAYFNPRFTAVEAVMVADEGVDTDADGTAIVDPKNDPRTYTSSPEPADRVYRVIIPAANSLGIDFSVTSWF